MKGLRIGHGYDVHRLTENRRLVLGGVLIPHDKGLLGHSDADVLIHSVMDSILGALTLGDIGKFFPDTSDEYKDIDSMKLLSSVYEMMIKRGYKISNIDATVIAQKPKLAPYIDKMRENIASVLHCEIDRVNVKATTEERLGFTGSEEGISSHAGVLLEE